MQERRRRRRINKNLTSTTCAQESLSLVERLAVNNNTKDNDDCLPTTRTNFLLTFFPREKSFAVLPHSSLVFRQQKWPLTPNNMCTFTYFKYVTCEPQPLQTRERISRIWCEEEKYHAIWTTSIYPKPDLGALTPFLPITQSFVLTRVVVCSCSSWYVFFPNLQASRRNIQTPSHVLEETFGHNPWGVDQRVHEQIHFEKK